MTSRWRYPRTMPHHTRCWVRTVSGIECEATRSWKVWRNVWHRNGVDRVHCWRRYIKSGGDLWVIAWKPMSEAPASGAPS